MFLAYSKHSECPNPTKRERESKGKKIENATQKGGNERNMRQRRERLPRDAKSQTRKSHGHPLSRAYLERTLRQREEREEKMEGEKERRRERGGMRR